MVAEPRYRSAARGFKANTPLILSSETMSHAMLRGVAAAISGEPAISGDEMLQATDACVIGLAAAGEAVAQGVRACSRRRGSASNRGRSEMDVDGEIVVPLDSLSIHSNPSGTEQRDTNNATTADNELEVWKTEAIRLHQIVKKQSEYFSNLIDNMQNAELEMQKKVRQSVKRQRRYQEPQRRSHKEKGGEVGTPLP